MRANKIITPSHNRKRTLRSRRPTLLLVRHGTVAVRTARGTYCAQSGDSILLAPGTFEIEATPAVRHGTVEVEVTTFSLAVLGRVFCGASVIEALVLGIADQENTGVYVQKGKAEMIDREAGALPSCYTKVDAMVIRILNTFAASTFPFVRFAFFEKRWALQLLLESHVLRADAVEWLAANYADGRAAFYRDCKIFVGLTPAKWVRQRRMQLARAWLRYGKADVEAVAKILKFCNVRAFRTALWKRYEMTIEELKDTEGLRLFGMPHVTFRPFWWPAPLPLRSELQTPGRPAEKSSQHIQPPSKPCEKPPAEVASDVPPADESCTKSKPVEERFLNMQMIPVAEIIPFPAELPLLLKAA